MIAVVVPSIREESIIRFISEWKIKKSDDYDLFVIEDNQKKTFKVPDFVFHYAHEDFDINIAGLIPTKTDAVRNYGFYMVDKFNKSLLRNYTHILTLDDDCYPNDNMINSDEPLLDLIHTHEKTITDELLQYSNKWFNTLEWAYPRGYPFNIAVEKHPVKLVIGGWDNVPDIDAVMQLSLMGKPFPSYKKVEQIIGYGIMNPMCGMHLFFPTEMIKYMYYLPSGIFEPIYQRWADIGLGYIIKRWCDEQGWNIVHSKTTINHSRASNPITNLEKESMNNGYFVNSLFAAYIQDSYQKRFERFEDLLRYVGMFDDKYDLGNNDYFKRINISFNQWHNLIGGK